jgi:hypothetical protein
LELGGKGRILERDFEGRGEGKRRRIPHFFRKSIYEMSGRKIFMTNIFILRKYYKEK